MTQADSIEPAQDEAEDDEEIRRLVARLSRPHRSGGTVVERAGLLAESADFDTVMRWIAERGGEPEAPVARRAARGLHAARSETADADRVPLRFILPPGALGVPATTARSDEESS